MNWNAQFLVDTNHIFLVKRKFIGKLRISIQNIFAKNAELVKNVQILVLLKQERKKGTNFQVVMKSLIRACLLIFKETDDYSYAAYGM